MQGAVHVNCTTFQRINLMGEANIVKKVLLEQNCCTGPEKTGVNASHNQLQIAGLDGTCRSVTKSTPASEGLSTVNNFLSAISQHIRT